MLLADGAFVAVDIETTGPHPGLNSIIEIGATRVLAGSVVGRFSELVRPENSIPRAIRRLTGIDDAMVSNAPPLADVMSRFRCFAQDAVLVAHNYRFDFGFLDLESERLWGVPFQRPVLDTLLLARKLHPEFERHSLQALCSLYDTLDRPDHRAGTDAAATAQIWELMCDELTRRGLNTAGDVANYLGMVHQKDLARKLSLVTDLPDRPGVYLMRDADGEVIHVGRSKSLREGVRNYFYTANPSQRRYQAAALTHSVGHVECVSQLDAILRESRLSLKYRPVLDTDRGRGREVVYLNVDTESEFPGMRVVQHRSFCGVNIGPLTNAMAAETLADVMRTHFGLRHCAESFEQARTAWKCPHRNDDTCSHPCLEAVPAATYAARVDAALAAFTDAESVERFQSAISAMREAAAMAQRYEDAITYREGLRALERTVSALRVIRRSARMEISVIIEGSSAGLAVHVTQYGYLVDTLRLDPEDITTGRWCYLLRLNLRSVLASRSGACADDELTERQIRDIFLIHDYRVQHSPLEIVRERSDQALIQAVVLAVSDAFSLLPLRRGGPSIVLR